MFLNEWHNKIEAIDYYLWRCHSHQIISSFYDSSCLSHFKTWFSYTLTFLWIALNSKRKSMLSPILWCYFLLLAFFFSLYFLKCQKFVSKTCKHNCLSMWFSLHRVKHTRTLNSTPISHQIGYSFISTCVWCENKTSTISILYMHNLFE